MNYTHIYLLALLGYKYSFFSKDILFIKIDKEYENLVIKLKKNNECEDLLLLHPSFVKKEGDLFILNVEKDLLIIDSVISGRVSSLPKTYKKLLYELSDLSQDNIVTDKYLRALDPTPRDRLLLMKELDVDKLPNDEIISSPYKEKEIYDPQST